MFNGPVFNNETIQSNARAVNGGGISEGLDEANALYSRLTGASFELVPSSYKGGTLYSGAPGANGDLSWTRGSDAFRTNASGVLQRVPWNLLQYSEQFDNAVWVKTNTTVTANSTNAPNGTTTGDTFVLTGTSSLLRSISQSSAGGNSLTNTFSVYVKYIDRPFIQLVWGTGYSTTDYANFNVQSGSVTAGTYTNATIVNAGDGWYRITITTLGTVTTPIVYVWPIDSSTASRASASSGGGSYYIWGAQLVEGTTAQTYLPTTDRLGFPRLDYTYGATPAMLLEPQRTNLALYSSAVGGTGWTMAFAGVGVTPTVTTNYAVAPDGTTSASRLQLSLNGGTTTLDQSLVVQVLTGTSCRGSFYIKTNDGSTKTIYVRGNLAYSIVIDGTWKRYDFDAGTLSTTQFGIGLRGGQTPTNSNTADILVWGAQLEQGAFQTTYIPTTSATVTRIADSFSRSNIYTNGLISASGGTWFVELRNNIVYTRDNSGETLGIGDTISLATNSLIIRNGGTSRLQIFKRISGATTTLYTTTTDTVKIAFKWNGTSADVFVNGTKQVSATAFTTTNMEFLNGWGQQQPIFIQQMALFSTLLSDTDCISLTADYTDGTSIVGDYERYVSQKSGAVENLSGVTNLIQNLK